MNRKSYRRNFNQPQYESMLRIIRRYPLLQVKQNSSSSWGVEVIAATTTTMRIKWQMMWFRSCSKPTRPFSETIFPQSRRKFSTFLVRSISQNQIFLCCSCLVVSAFPSLCKFDISIGLLNSVKRRSLVSEKGIDKRSIFLKRLRPRLPKELETIPEILLFLFL